jgi:dUTP pyrophosphatase
MTLRKEFFMSSVTISLTRLDHAKELSLPTYATPQSAGMDLLAAVSQPITLQPGERKLVPTGLTIALPDGYEAQIRPRSGLAFKNGITVANAPGTIDADYRGEVGVLLVNLGTEPFVIERGMRIAQMVIAAYTRATFSEMLELPVTVRGAGGFGSTGTKG